MSEQAINPTDAAIVAALRAGRASEAESLARARLASRPDDPQALVMLAIALGLLDRNPEAVDLYRRLVELQPREPAHRNNLGNALREIGDLAGAEQAHRGVLEMSPDDVNALSCLGLIRWQQGDAVETRELMLAACRLDPGLPEPRIYGALACHECADNETAERLVADHKRWNYVGPVMESDLATVLMDIDQFDEAEERLRSLLANPDAAGIARLRLAGLLERLNRLDEAEALLVDYTASPMDRDEDLAVRAALAARRGRHDEAAGLYRLALQSQAGGTAKAQRWFALGKACDAAGDSVGAMQALATAHELQMQHATRLLPHLADPGNEPLSITNFPVDAAAHARWRADPDAPDANSSPIFIVGFPRSGTTLLEQMLDAHPGLSAMDERAFLQDVIAKMQASGELTYPEDLDRLMPADLAELRATYWRCVEGVVQLQPGDRLVDKNPLNILRLPMIHRIFPHARIVLALRHPCDVILSNYMQSFRAPAFQVLCSSLERLARGYANAMNFWNRHAELFQPAVLELRYEDLLDDVVGQTERIARHLDLTDATALERFQEHARAKGFISTPSYAQVVEPLNKKAVGRWHRYRQYLEPVLPVLEPLMKRWNYHA